MVKDVCGRENCTEDCPDPVRLPIDTGTENAFFLETSGSGMLNIRQACAVESLAYHNPNLNVNVLFVGGHINGSSNTTQKLAETYTNLRLIGVDLDEYLAGTALEKWYHCTDWRKGPYHVSHLSDGLRFLTLNKFGGYYFDLDVLIVKSVINYRNFVAVESKNDMGSGVIHADMGSPLMKLSVKDFADNYR
jgi:lactosylceramide 4-alpha-galactosyltransferase